jgi:hypothetical protein
MTLQDCMAALQSANKIAVCSVTDAGPLSQVSTIASIVASAAIIATAIFAWRQLFYLHQQIVDTKTAVKNQILANSQNERLSSTLQLLMQMQTNDHWRENRLKFVNLRDHKDGLKRHSLENSDDALCIRSVLNQYELIALGIHSEILDNDMFRKYYRGTVLRDWTACLEFITAERSENQRYWSELEALAKQFHPST